MLFATFTTTHYQLPPISQSAIVLLSEAITFLLTRYVGHIPQEVLIFITPRFYRAARYLFSKSDWMNSCEQLWPHQLHFLNFISSPVYGFSRKILSDVEFYQPDSYIFMMQLYSAAPETQHHKFGIITCFTPHLTVFS